MRELPLLAIGKPASWRVVAPAFLAALAGWVASATALLVSAGAMARLQTWDRGVLLAVHLAGLVVFPYAVAGGAWHSLPTMLRTMLAGSRRLTATLVLLLGGPVLAVAVSRHNASLAWAAGTALVAGVALLAAGVVSLVVRAPRNRMLVASRFGVVAAVVHGALAFLLGAVLFESRSAEIAGIEHDRLLLVHLLLAVVGWLVLLLMTVGRVLAPMLVMAPAPPARRFPLAEMALVAALWPALVGLALGLRALAFAGTVALAAVLAVFGWSMVRAAVRGRLGLREGPLAHALIGMVALLQAAAVALLGLGGVLDERRAAVAVGVLLLAGFAVSVLVGFAGKLLGLSAWANWPPGPRPKQGAFYPRRAWQAEILVFAVGSEAVAAGVLFRSVVTVRIGAGLLVAAALLALAGGVATAVAARRLF